MKYVMLLIMTFLLQSYGCKKAERSSSGSSGLVGGGSSTSTSTETSTDTSNTLAITVGEVASLKVSQQSTNTTSEDSCVTIPFSVKREDTAVSGETVTFEMTFTSGEKDDAAFEKNYETELAGKDNKEDLLNGYIDPKKVETDEKGAANVTYCSGYKRGKVLVVAKSNSISANSPEIEIIRANSYSFEFKDFSYPYASQLESDNSKKDLSVIIMTLANSGPRECVELYYTLLNAKEPEASKTVRFKTQVNYPKGVKLAKKEDDGLTGVDSTTEKKYAYYDAVSSADGILSVPVCAGEELGTMVVTGSFKEDDDSATEHSAASPVLRITSGLTNYANMSLTYDSTNAKTLKAYFNQNSDDIHTFWVKLGTMQDGDSVTDYPVSVMAETGKIIVENGGVPDATDGTVKFTMQMLHMGNYRPYQVYSYKEAAANTRCDPEALSEETNGVLYSDLRKNWRSTLVYMIRGQEHYNDANRNGKFDEGGHGFWDKNQNGVFDEGDELTNDPDNDGKFDINDEWFIDLPTPFIDVDEDGSYNADKDILLGDEYSAPNGKRDADTMIWKYDYIPIYFGISMYSIQNSEIKSKADGGITDFTDTIGLNYFTTLHDNGVRMNDEDLTTKSFGTDYDIGEDELWGVGATTQEKTEVGTVWRYIFAHDVCGNPLPGDTEISVNLEVSANAPEQKCNKRTVGAGFYLQAGDHLLEPSRRLLKEAQGGSSTKINFNVTDHPSAAVGYPVEFDVFVGECTFDCTGPVKTEGVVCDAGNYDVKVKIDNITVGGALTYDQVKTCACGYGSVPTDCGCECPEGYEENDTGNGCCPAGAGYTDDGNGHCICPDGFVEDNGKCVAQ